MAVIAAVATVVVDVSFSLRRHRQLGEDVHVAIFRYNHHQTGLMITRGQLYVSDTAVVARTTRPIAIL